MTCLVLNLLDLGLDHNIGHTYDYSTMLEEKRRFFDTISKT